MDNRKTIFCEMAFLEKFKESRPYSMFPTEESIREEQIWNNLNLALFNSNIRLDCDDQKLKKRTEEDEYMKYLWKRSVGGLCGVECIGEKFPNIQADILDYQDENKKTLLNALFLTDKDNFDSASSWGVLNMSSNNYLLHGEFFKDNGIAIRKGDEVDWDFLKTKAKHNLNSLIIVDNYVLKRINENLVPILDSILPQQLNMPFVITIFTMQEESEKYQQILKKKLEEIRPESKSNPPKIKFEIEIFNVGKDQFHDRAIISNNLLIGIGGGFDLLRRVYLHKESTKTTNVSIVYPYIQQGIIEWADKAYSNIIEDARHCLEIIDKDKHSKNYLLNTVNNLD